MRRFMDSVCAVLCSALLIDQLQRGLETLADYLAACSAKAVDKARSGVTLFIRVAVAAYLKMICLFGSLLLYTASTVAVCLVWVSQVVKTGFCKIWSATSTLSALHISNFLNDFGNRLSVVDRLFPPSLSPKLFKKLLM